ncbi:14018_t:CDS:2 [Racocetra fulgida]|uniref:14018_t:CDS:1 n=1 Tax=Racocetra fulgida TaxID=60492 RepID=A0A9N9A432_9GLOM|nr:14018_t:CDS:2 [Racocetra fulgida]
MKETEKIEKDILNEGHYTHTTGKSNVEEKNKNWNANEEREAEKQRERQFQQVNKLKYDKLEMTREMIVDIENSLVEGTLGSLIRDHLEQKMMTINAFQHNVPGIIKFRRKVTAEWSDELGAFVPIPETIQEEVYIFYYLEIETFVQFIENDSLHTHISSLQKIFHNKKLVLLIKGFDGYCRKKKIQQNRTFTNAVRTGIDPSVENDGQSKKKQTIIKGPDQEKIEEELIWLQLIAKVMIVHTKDTEETAEIIGILNRHSTIKSLYDAYNGCRTQEEAENLLTDVEIPNNGLGHRNRYVNKALSKRIYEIFMGNNADTIIS